MLDGNSCLLTCLGVIFPGRMSLKMTWFCWMAALLLPVGLQAKLTPEQVGKLPAPATHKIDFSKEIKPILETSCRNCHGRGKEKGDFKIDDRATFLKGGDSGPAVVPGKSEESL